MGRLIDQPTAPLTGYAVIKLRDGNTYVGEVVCTDRLVTIDGCEREYTLVNGAAVVSYRRRRRRTVPVGAVAAIWWDDDA